jgi:chromosome segregation ATPase
MKPGKEDTNMETTVDMGYVEEMGKDVLGAVQSLRELLEARSTTLEACQKALEEQYAQFAQEREDFSRQQSELSNLLQKEKTDLDEREKLCQDAEVQQKEFLAREETLTQWKARLTQEEEKLQKLSNSITGDRSRVEHEQEVLAVHRQDLAKEKEEVLKREAELSKAVTSLEQRRKELDIQESQINLNKKEWDTRVRELEATRSSLSGLQTQLHQELNKVASEKVEILPNAGLMQNNEVRGSMERFQKLCRDAKRRAIGAEGK